jgi:NAD(P)-dependent dehydrogenase (short-subunit alcohol dehydrogenase family)
MAGATYDVSGRTVFITGAARGIGKATAQRLHGKGANVALVGLEPELLEQNAAELGERAIAIEADVTDLGALERAVEATVARFGGIDVAIANAGIAFTGPLMAAPVARVERTLEVNLLGVWRTDRAVIEELTKRGGYLLNISSLTAILRPPMIAAYATAKAGVEALSDALRVESAPSGVAVGCAYFGFMDTDLVKAAYAEPSAEAMNARTPSFIRNPAPLSKAIDAIERGVERRSARVWAPRWLGPMLVARGLLQPLIERGGRAQEAELVEAMRIAAESNEAAGQDELLGVAGKALDR